MEETVLDSQAIKRLYWVTLLITVTAFLFWRFFDFCKRSPVRELNPFSKDPYDIVGSFGFQIALLVAILTFARALRLRESAAESFKARLIIRGNKVVLLTIVITLIADGIALLRVPLPDSYWAHVLLFAWGLMSGIAVLCIAVLSIVLRKTSIGPVPNNLTPADGLDDLWTLVRVAVNFLRSILPQSFVLWANTFDSDELFARCGWIDARRHPWRFAFALSLVAAIVVYLFKLTEGPSPNLLIAIVVAVIFITAELLAAVLGFTLLGGHLGLRPPLRRAPVSSK